MVVRKREGSLTKEEQRIVKALLARKMRNQDIQDLLNKGRAATVNSARITEVKGNSSIEPASDDDVSFFVQKKQSYDPRTGLNHYDDERLIRAREAMNPAHIPAIRTSPRSSTNCILPKRRAAAFAP